MTKLQFYYNIKTNDFYFIEALNILDSDKILVASNHKPLELLNSTLTIGLVTIVKEERKFSFLLKDKQGNLVIDNYGELVPVIEYRNIDTEKIKYIRIKTTEEFDYYYSIINNYDSVFISYGNNKRKYLDNKHKFKIERI